MTSRAVIVFKVNDWLVDFFFFKLLDFHWMSFLAVEIFPGLLTTFGVWACELIWCISLFLRVFPLVFMHAVVFRSGMHENLVSRFFPALLNVILIVCCTI